MDQISLQTILQWIEQGIPGSIFQLVRFFCAFAPRLPTALSLRHPQYLRDRAVVFPDHLKTFVLVALVLFCTVQKGFGFLLTFLLPFFLIYLIYNFIVIIRKAAERKRRTIRIAIWSVALVLAGTVQVYWATASRNAADSALHKVLAFRERAGAYPSSLAEVGLEEQALRAEWGVRYFVQEGKPRLVYPAPVMPLTMYEYDFDTHTWWQNAH